MAGSPDARRGRPTAAASGGRADPASQRLAERLHEIAADAPAPEDALEPALRAILEACGATAGAICLFDQRNELLRLAAEVGLSDEGCRQLRSVRRGGVGTWDMPLHSLLNRRAYLIESAAKNRYVPPLVEPAASVRTLACVPLYAGSTPLASLILVAMIPASFNERDIRVLDQAIRELVQMIEAVRRRAPGQSPAPVQDVAPSQPPADTPVRRPHTRATISPELSASMTSRPPVSAAAPGGPPADPATTEVLATALAESERERTRLATALEQALASAGGTPASNDEPLRRALQAVEAAESAHATAAAEAEAARVEATRCRAEIQRLETAVREHAEERAKAEAALAAATAGATDDAAARAQRDAEAEAATAQLAARVVELERERDALVLERNRLHEAASAAGDAETARAELAQATATLETLARETERLRGELATAAEQRQELERVVQDHERLAHEREQLAQERDRLVHELDVERTQAAARQAELDETLSALAGLRAECDAALARIQALETERDTLRVAAAAASEAEAAQAALTAAQGTIDGLHAELEQVRADVERLTTAERELRDAQARAAEEALEARARIEQEAAEALARERTALEEQLATLRAERDETAAAFGVEREALREQLGALEARLADVTAAGVAAAEAASAADAARAELAALQATVDALRDESTQARAELDRLATAEEALLADRARLEQALSEAQEAAQAVEVAAEAVVLDETLEAEAVLTMEAPPEDLTAVADAPAAPEPAADLLPEPPASTEPAADHGPRLVILDVDGVWDGLACPGFEVARLAPDADAVTRVVALSPQRLVVNLAADGALETLFQIRAAGVTARCFGVIAASGAKTLLPLASIDAGCRPLDPDAMIATMSSYGGQGTRVVMVGADVDALISLRQALSRQGLSVSMAWNAKQAEDLLGMVKPQVAVVDLDLPQRDGYGIVARLAGMSPVPTMLLVQGVEASGPRFAALLADPAHRERLTAHDRLLNEVGAWKEPPPKEKGKVRQLAR